MAKQRRSLITSATRRVSEPSRLMTPEHLEVGAEGGKGRMAREPPEAERGGAAATPPKFKKQSLKGRAQAGKRLHSIPGDTDSTPQHTGRHPGSSKLLKGPQWGAAATARARAELRPPGQRPPAPDSTPQEGVQRRPGGGSRSESS